MVLRFKAHRCVGCLDELEHGKVLDSVHNKHKLGSNLSKVTNEQRPRQAGSVSHILEFSSAVANRDISKCFAFRGQGDRTY